MKNKIKLYIMIIISTISSLIAFILMYFLNKVTVYTYDSGSYKLSNLTSYLYSKSIENNYIYILLFIITIIIFFIFVIFFFVSFCINKIYIKIVKSYEKSFVILKDLVMEKINLNTALLEFEAQYEELMPISEYFKELLYNISNKNDEINSIINSLGDGIVVLNSNFIVLLLNNEAVAFFGEKPDLIGIKITNIYKNEAFVNAIQTVKKNKNRIILDLKDNKDAIYRFFINPASDEMIVILMSDVTELISLENVRSEFVANVSHELKTPLTSISGFADLISNGLVKDYDKIVDYNSKIVNESKRLIQLVNDILKLSHIENGENEQNDNVSLLSIFTYVFEVLMVQTKEKNITYEIVGELVILASTERIYELAFNLIDNAIKYNVMHGKIKVNILNDEYNCGFEVCDTGIGIAKNEINRIFERFYRVDKARVRNTSSTGLGLSIAKHIAEKHGGVITVKRKKKGTTFCVLFSKNIVVEMHSENTIEIDIS
jgi:two-component system, OmpR family, phosphate regulon sensor histidine kinase PhoR